MSKSQTTSFDVIEEKVGKDNILVVNELLAYIQNKVSDMDTLYLVEICCRNFTYSEILKAKSVLVKCATITYPKNRGSKSPEQKARRHMQDLVKIFEKTDPKYFPTFVAKDFSKFLPISSINFSLKQSFEYMMVIKDEIFAIRDVVESTDEAVNDLRQMVENLQKEMAGETSERASLASSASDATARSDEQEGKPDQKFLSWVDDELNNHKRTDHSQNEIDEKPEASSVTEESPTIHYYKTNPNHTAESPQQSCACDDKFDQSQSLKTPPKMSVLQENSSADPGPVSSKQTNSRYRRRRHPHRRHYMPSGQTQQQHRVNDDPRY